MQSAFIVGWEEWLALPELGLPAIKAKVDTGARTSALHAFLIEPFGPAEAPMVRFGIHPIPGRHDIEVYCSAPIVDRREVTSSNGEKEMRTVIRTTARIGERDWPIEVTLTNRDGMSYRMLLGRQAIREDMYVDPAASFRQPKLSYRLYRHLPRRDPVRRPLRIALITAGGGSPSGRRFSAAATARGHVIEMLDADRLSLVFAGSTASLTLDGVAVPHYDAIVPRVAGTRRAAAVRQLELMGGLALNPADAIARLASPLETRQALSRAGIAGPDTVLLLTAASSEPVQANPGASNVGRQRTSGPRLELTVVGDAVAAAIEVRHGHASDVGNRALVAAYEVAQRAARALGLGFATVTLTGDADVPIVAGVSALPSLTRVEAVTGVRLAEAVVAVIEERVRSWVRREPQPATTAESAETG